MRRRRYLLATVALLALTAAGVWQQTVMRGRVWRPYRDSFAHGDTSDWKFFGGTWTVQEGVLENLSGARGDRAQTGSAAWKDYVVETDLRINSDPDGSHWGDAGVVFRVTDPATGVDAYDGYYVGIGIESNHLFIGRSNYSWTRLSGVPLAAPARRGKWYRLRVLAKGCYFEAVARDPESGGETRLQYFDRDCTKLAGAAGVRTFSVQASWRDFRVFAP